MQTQLRSSTAARPRCVQTNRLLQTSLRNKFRRTLCQAAPLNLDDLDFDIPEIDGDLRSLQTDLGATFNADGVAQTFGNSDKAIEALEAGVVLLDRSHWGRLRVAGEGRMEFLHNQSTNDFRDARPGQALDTVFVTATARTIDLATAIILEQGALLLTHPSTRQMLAARFNKYIFPADKVTVTDVSSKTSMITLIGPESDNILRELGAGDMVGKPYGTHTLLKLKDKPVMVVVHSGLATSGYTFITDEAIAVDLYGAFAAKGCIPMGEEEWERARILEGRPEPGAELTEDYNPLEAGLYGAVSVNKGCYIGQETLAKLANLDGVKQQLWGLRNLPAGTKEGDEITSDGGRVGKITSVTKDLEGRLFGLGYIRCKSGGAQVQLQGAVVKVKGVPVSVVSIPFATRAFREGTGPVPSRSADAAGGSMQDLSEEARKQKAEQAAKAAAEKQAKLQVSDGEAADAASSSGAGGEGAAGARQVDKWRLIVDVELPPHRRARIVDVRDVQMSSRHELSLSADD